VSGSKRQLARFLFTGGFATALQYAVLAVGTGVFGFSAALSSGLGYLAGSALSYLMSYFFTFQANRSHREAAVRFYVMVAVAWCLNTMVMAVLADVMGLNKWVSQIFATLLTLVWNFMVSRAWVFKAA